MEAVTKLAWGFLALIHASPAAVLIAPSLVKRLYGIEANGALGVLLVHRGALFLAILAVCLLALFDPPSRRAASVVVGISVIAFLIVYAQAGSPAGPLRTVALVDLLGLAPLAWVVISAFRPHAA